MIRLWCDRRNLQYASVQAQKHAAEQALAWLKQHDYHHAVIAVGSGRTVNTFIQQLATLPLSGCTLLAASQASQKALQQHGMVVEDPNTVTRIDYYFDSADEIDPHLAMIKGGGMALTGEKILASMAQHFVCMVERRKQVAHLGTFPLPVEIIPMARSFVSRQLHIAGGDPQYRVGALTDHGNVIVDVHNLKIDVPIQWEERLNQIPGLVTHGIFAQRRADTLIVGDSENED